MLLFGSGNWMQRSGSHNLPIMPLPFSMGFDFEELKTKITQLFERCWPVLSQTTSQRTNVQATHTHTCISVPEKHKNRRNGKEMFLIPLYAQL